jgi:hypothetical protein
LVIPVKTGIQEGLEITGYTLKGTIAGLRLYDKIDAWTSLRKGFATLFTVPRRNVLVAS